MKNMKESEQSFEINPDINMMAEVKTKPAANLHEIKQLKFSPVTSQGKTPKKLPWNNSMISPK